MEIPAHEEQRLGFINCETNSLHDNINDIYEGLVDRDDGVVLCKVEAMIKDLKCLIEKDVLHKQVHLAINTLKGLVLSLQEED